MVNRRSLTARRPCMRHTRLCGLLRYLMLSAIASACGDNTSAPKEPADAIKIGVGETRAIDPSAAPIVHVSGGAAGAEYTLVGFAAPEGPVITMQVAADNVIEAVGPPNPTRVATTLSTTRSVLSGPFQAGADLHLSSIDRERLASRLGAVRRTLVARAQVTPVIPAVGDELTLNVSLDACGPPVLHTARVVDVSVHAVLVEDELNPSGGFSADDYQSIADEYETLILPVLSDNFGVPSDIDNNGGRTIVLFTRAVNELTPPGGSGFITSFFYVRDLIPKTACAGSNEAELLYLMAPDPSGEINGQVWSATDTRTKVGISLAHSGQHLVNQSRRLYVTHAPIEATWVEEGMSDIAQELVFYRASALAAKRNLSLDDLLAADAIRDAVNTYQGANLLRLQVYLANTESYAPTSGDGSLETSGAAWELLRYLADRSAVPERTIWNTLVNGATTGIANLATATGLDVAAAERDWAVAQYTDDAGIPVSATLQEPSWNFRSVLPGLHNDLGFPLAPHVLASSSPLSLRLERGGATYLRFGVSAGQYATIHVPLSNPQTMSQYLSLTLVRTK